MLKTTIMILRMVGFVLAGTAMGRVIITDPRALLIATGTSGGAFFARSDLQQRKENLKSTNLGDLEGPHRHPTAANHYCRFTEEYSLLCSIRGISVNSYRDRNPSTPSLCSPASLLINERTALETVSISIRIITELIETRRQFRKPVVSEIPPGYRRHRPSNPGASWSFDRKRRINNSGMSIG